MRISIGKLTNEDEKILIEGIDLLVRAAGNETFEKVILFP